MKVSLNLVKEFTPVNLSNDELVAKIGAQIGAVEAVTDLSAAYKGVVIVKVIKVDPHTNADKLHICLIDDGGVIEGVDRLPDGGYVQVVCGAPNVAEGQLVAWVSPGSIVPATHKYAEPMAIDSCDVRGVTSHGMLASAKELALGTDHNGIMVIDGDVQPGTSLAEYYHLNDLIIDIENKMFTHRPDCFGVLGVAREIAGIQNIQFKSPSNYLQADVPAEPSGTTLPIVIKNELPELCPRFMAVAMSNIKIKPSPLELQSCLIRLGVRPVNNVVDTTNYIMLLTGQPLHAYDYDKVLAMDAGAQQVTIAVRYPSKDEELTLLNGKTIKPYEKAMLISTATKAIGLAGVMGGGDTEVSDTTKNILLECATFDSFSIRRTAMQHGVFTDAVTRYSKGQSPLQCPCALAHAMNVLQELANAKIASPVIDDNHSQPIPSVTTNAEFINSRLGSELSADEIAQLLRNVEFTVELQTPNSQLLITPPYWRMDIAIAEDIVEEVGRLYGYDKLPQNLPSRSLKPVKKDELLELKAGIRQILSAAGANEVLTYSFVHGNTLKKAGQDPEKAFALGNALSPDLQYYRLSLTPSLLEKVHPNIKAGFDYFALFEMGKVHIKDWLDDEKLPKEESRLAFVFAAGQGDGPAYYVALKYLSELVSLGINASLINLPVKAELAINEQLAAPYAKERAALIVEKDSGELLGIIGEFKPAVAKTFKLPPFAAGFELDLSKILKFRNMVSQYQDIARYPKVEQDITLKVDAEIGFIKLAETLIDELHKITSSCQVNLRPIDIYQSEDDKAHKNVTMRISVSSYERTLKAEEVNAWLDEAAKNLASHFSVQRI